MFDVPVLAGEQPAAGQAAPREWRIVVADRTQTAAYRMLRRDVFVAEQGLFAGDDGDDVDEDPRTVVLVAIASDGTVIGGVRVAPAAPGPDIGWWTGSRLAADRQARRAGGVGSALVRAACATALEHGVLRFEATVQEPNRVLFERLGWRAWGEEVIGGMRHARMRWPIDRIARLVAATKASLGELTGSLRHDSPAGLGGRGFVGDDGAPVPGTDVIACCDAILPALVEKDPEWAGWCGVLVNLNDLAAMGAEPVGLLDALGAPSRAVAHRVLNGLRSAALAWDVPVLGGHTQLGVPAQLAVTALGRTREPVPGGGGRAGQAVSVTADLHGGWRRGFEGRQWDSSSARSGEELRHLGSLIARAAPAAAKDVSMAGIVGTAGMLAEAGGVGAVLDVARIPAPESAATGDWLSCFPGFAMVTADDPGASRIASPIAAGAECGRLTEEPGVRLRWPDGVETEALAGRVTGLGTAREEGR